MNTTRAFYYTNYFFKKNLDLKNPSTLLLDDILIKWAAEQRRLEIGLKSNEIMYKFLELDPRQNK